MIVAVISIVLIYFAGKELFSSRVGIIASVLLAINPLFVFFTRQGILYEWTLVCIFLLIMILSLRYVKNLKNRNLATVLFLIPLCIFSYAWLYKSESGGNAIDSEVTKNDDSSGQIAGNPKSYR